MQKREKQDQYEFILNQEFKGKHEDIVLFFKNNSLDIEKVVDSGDSKKQFLFHGKSSQNKKIIELPDWNTIDDSDDSSDEEKGQTSQTVSPVLNKSDSPLSEKSPFTPFGRNQKFYPRDQDELKSFIEKCGDHTFFNFMIFNVDYKATEEDMHNYFKEAGVYKFKSPNDQQGKFLITVDKKSALQVLAISPGRLKKTVQSNENDEIDLVATNITVDQLKGFYQNVELIEIKENQPKDGLITFRVPFNDAINIFDTDFPEFDNIISEISIFGDTSSYNKHDRHSHGNEKPYKKNYHDRDDRERGGYRNNSRDRDGGRNRQHQGRSEGSPDQMIDLRKTQSDSSAYNPDAKIEMNQKRKQKISERDAGYNNDNFGRNNNNFRNSNNDNNRGNKGGPYQSGGNNNSGPGARQEGFRKDFKPKTDDIVISRSSKPPGVSNNSNNNKSNEISNQDYPVAPLTKILSAPTIIENKEKVFEKSSLSQSTSPTETKQSSETEQQSTEEKYQVKPKEQEPKPSVAHNSGQESEDSSSPHLKKTQNKDEKPKFNNKKYNNNNQTKVIYKVKNNPNQTPQSGDVAEDDNKESSGPSNEGGQGQRREKQEGHFKKNSYSQEDNEGSDQEGKKNHQQQSFRAHNQNNRKSDSERSESSQGKQPRSSGDDRQKKSYRQKYSDHDDSSQTKTTLYVRQETVPGDGNSKQQGQAYSKKNKGQGSEKHYSQKEQTEGGDFKSKDSKKNKNKKPEEDPDVIEQKKTRETFVNERLKEYAGNNFVKTTQTKQNINRTTNTFALLN